MTNREWNPGELLELSGILSSRIQWMNPFSRLFFPSICCWIPIPDRLYSEQQLMDMLTEAVLKDIKRLPVQSSNDSGLITGIV
jgi:hypothetical protein